MLHSVASHRVRVDLAAFCFAVVAVSMGPASARPAKRGPHTRHLQYLCTSAGLQVFRIGGSGTLKPVYTAADPLPLLQIDYIGGLLPDPQGHSIFVSWDMTYNQGAAIAAEIDRMQLSPQGKLFSVSHQSLPLNTSAEGPRSLALAAQGKLLLAVFNLGPGDKNPKAPRKTFLRAYRTLSGGPLRPVDKPVFLRSSFQSLTADPTGRFVYLTNAQDSHIYQYRVLQNGVLAPLAVPALRTAKPPKAIVFHPSRRFAYVTSEGENSVVLYRQKLDGKLAPSAHYSLPKNTLASPLAPTLAITPNGRFLYACAPAGSIFQYRISANGTLQPLTSSSIHTGGYKMVVAPSGRFAYSLSNTTGTNVIYQYRIQGSGTLLPLMPRFVSQIGSAASMTIIQN